MHHLDRNEFERDVPRQARVFRFIDDAHATTTELANNAIVGDCLADHSGGLSAVRGYGRPVEKLRSTLAPQRARALFRVPSRRPTRACLDASAGVRFQRL